MQRSAPGRRAHYIYQYQYQHQYISIISLSIYTYTCARLAGARIEAVGGDVQRHEAWVVLEELGARGRAVPVGARRARPRAARRQGGGRQRGCGGFGGWPSRRWGRPNVHTARAAAPLYIAEDRRRGARRVGTTLGYPHWGVHCGRRRAAAGGRTSRLRCARGRGTRPMHAAAPRRAQPAPDHPADVRPRTCHGKHAADTMRRAADMM
jgi:hypothetical protein